MTRFQPSPDFNVSDFLINYWQQKPLLIKNFLSNFSDPMDGNELAGLALEEGVESRLVTSNAQGGYSLAHGPFREADFQALPADNWTLLVQAVDQLIPQVATIKQAFDFLPSWRIDDVMVSHAVPGGGVGPHWDQYDVFLLQGAGRRYWKLGGMCSEESMEVSDSGLKLLREFHTKQEFTLESGDALYIPPGIAHWGISEQAGLCYSIGFRAPSQAELTEALSDRVIEALSEFTRYQDSPMQAPVKPGEISSEGLENAWKWLQPALLRPDLLRQAFGELVTQPRYPEMIEPPLQTLDRDEFLDCRGTPLWRNPASRFAWAENATSPELVSLFIDGEMINHSCSNLEALISLCDLSIENIWEINSAKQQDAWLGLLLELTNRGSLWLADQ